MYKYKLIAVLNQKFKFFFKNVYQIHKNLSIISEGHTLKDCIQNLEVVCCSNSEIVSNKQLFSNAMSWFLVHWLPFTTRKYFTMIMPQNKS